MIHIRVNVCDTFHQPIPRSREQICRATLLKRRRPGSTGATRRGRNKSVKAVFHGEVIAEPLFKLLQLFGRFKTKDGKMLHTADRQLVCVQGGKIKVKMADLNLCPGWAAYPLCRSIYRA